MFGKKNFCPRILCLPVCVCQNFCLKNFCLKEFCVLCFGNRNLSYNQNFVNFEKESFFTCQK